ncbi:CDGSH iron-sulfur domain-containing protein [Pontivivens insulae]|uniref:Iron-binding zinc finger CDGSH type domain-containing protein n=1 Tax=Pontivivens insulae TaxID=1639689 RepID=A0A2R8A9U1_9RHOB|nr:CDGSH iron-sulfur domain-containing protein [Pontivivens insulae]RED12749.1 CDGSH-type Zn-finger protein [Pontivivens insulae]SPF28840.1 hypothetical protein POI8812_01143 [Pontivivens insulae]
MTDKPVIAMAEDGPLIVSNPPDLTSPVSGSIETGAKAFLCRCGKSANKPFCDGSHKAAGFSSANDGPPKRNKALTYTGTTQGVSVTISYTPVLCTHAAECVTRAGGAFDPEKKPWCQPENETFDKMMDAVAACPSGALRMTTGEVTPHHLTTGEVSITIAENGPLHVKNIPLDAEFNGAEASHAKYSLCRCGRSSNKPFCDGSHRDAGWSDED